MSGDSPRDKDEMGVDSSNADKDQSVDLESHPLSTADLNEDPNFDAGPIQDAGYAWVVCCACFFLNFCTWGMNSGFAIYLSEYLNNGSFKGATKIDYAYIGGIAFGVGLVFSPVTNYIMGKIGTTSTIIIGSCLQFTALMLASWAKSLWQLYCTQGLMQSFGLGIICIPTLTLLPQYFKKKRVLAGGIASAGSGAGGVVFNLGMQRVMEVRSVQWALRAQSIIGFGILWIAIVLIYFRDKRGSRNIKFSAFDTAVIRCPAIWILALFVVTCMFGYVIVLYTLALYTRSMGYTEYQGLISSALVQAGSFFGRPIVGLASDRFGAVTVAASVYMCVGIFCFAMWIPARNLATIYAFAILEGMFMGTIYGTIGAILPRTFGIAKMNVSFSMLWVLLGVSGIFSPVIGIKLTTGSAGSIGPGQYTHCAIFSGCSFVVCSLSLLFLRGYIKARDLASIDEKADSDLQDLTTVHVPLSEALLSCFKKSHEKT